VGVRTTGLWLDGDDLIERRSEDVEPVLEQAKALRSCGMVGSSEFRHAASFPASVVELYKQKAGISHHEFMANPVHIRRMLSDPELQGFRVWEGKVKRG
jgi:hypothetical protein